MPVVVGVDLGGTKIQAAVLRGRRVAGQGRSKTPAGRADEIVDAVVKTVEDALAASGASLSEIGSVGVGFPGRFDRASGDTLYAVNLAGFEERYPFGKQLSARLNSAPVTLDNDVRAALNGEYRMGNGRGYRNLLGVFVGTGVGGGLVLEGRVRHGRGAAGEIGHTVVKDGGRECGCGRLGCLEAYAGRGRMELRARKLVDEGQKTTLFEIMKRKGRDRLTSGVFDAALRDGDRVARALVDEAVWALGLSLASVQNVLDLEAIIVGGGLGDRLGAPFIQRVAESMQPHLFVDRNPPQMLGTALGDLSGAVGAALLAGATRRAPAA